MIREAEDPGWAEGIRGGCGSLAGEVGELRLVCMGDRSGQGKDIVEVQEEMKQA